MPCATAQKDPPKDAAGCAETGYSQEDREQPIFQGETHRITLTRMSEVRRLVSGWWAMSTKEQSRCGSRCSCAVILFSFSVKLYMISNWSKEKFRLRVFPYIIPPGLLPVWAASHWRDQDTVCCRGELRVSEIKNEIMFLGHSVCAYAGANSVESVLGYTLKFWGDAARTLCERRFGGFENWKGLLLESFALIYTCCLGAAYAPKRDTLLSKGNYHCRQ